MSGICKMCTTGQIGVAWARQIITGEKAMSDAAAFFGMSQDEVLAHINEHEIKTKPKEMVTLSDKRYDSDDFYLKELLAQLNLLKDWSAYLNPEGKNDITLHNITALTKLSAEIRKTIEVIAVMQGRMSQEGQVINVLKIEQRYYELTNIILQESCPECRAKILKVLEQPLNLTDTQLIKIT